MKRRGLTPVFHLDGAVGVGSSWFDRGDEVKRLLAFVIAFGVCLSTGTSSAALPSAKCDQSNPVLRLCVTVPSTVVHSGEKVMVKVKLRNDSPVDFESVVHAHVYDPNGGLQVLSQGHAFLVAGQPFHEAWASFKVQQGWVPGLYRVVVIAHPTRSSPFLTDPSTVVVTVELDTSR
jgi:hypothetical protein